MILAIRALRATIFAFNASIIVTRAAVASVTEAVTDRAFAESTDGPAPVVPEITHAADAVPGALNATVETPPSEETVVALTANRRGYLAPIAGGTLEMHVSDKNTVPAGAYPFDMFVQDSAGDWDCLASGTVVVEAAVSAPPT